jgi:hypothetical protein
MERATVTLDVYDDDDDKDKKANNLINRATCGPPKYGSEFYLNNLLLQKHFSFLCVCVQWI